METRYRHLRTAANYTFGELETDTENPEGESMTIPDMAMSLQQILDRQVRGLEIPTFDGTYSEDEFPDLERMDLAERSELLENTKLYVNQLQAKMQQAEEQSAMQTSQPAETV